MVVPSGTVMASPSMVSETVRRADRRVTGAESLIQSQALNGRLDGAVRRLAKSTDRRVFHTQSNLIEQRDFVGHTPARPSRRNAVQRFLLPHRPHATRHALAARFIAEEC